MKKYEPELGQYAFGQPCQSFKCPRYLERALEAIRSAMEVSQTCDPKYTPFDNMAIRFKNDVFEANAYSWAECNCSGFYDTDWTADKCTCGYEPQLYNFKYKDIEVSWYKYLGRGMSVNRRVTTNEAKELLKDCLKSLLK